MSGLMKALNLYGVNDLRYEDAPIPEPTTDEVLLKIKAAGVCGSDIPRVFVKGTYHFPTIIGHEFSGEIVRTGDGDPALVGKRASVFPLIPCHKCLACREKHYAQCSDYDYYGSRRNGAMAEFLAVKRENLCLLPDEVSCEEGAMNEPAAVALHAYKKSAAKAGDTVLIYGLGAIAFILAQWAKTQGVAKIILVGRTADKVLFARDMGFSLAVNAEEGDLASWVAEATQGRGVDVAFEGTGESKPLAACLNLTKNFGTVVCLGNPVGEMTLSQGDYWRIMRKELRVIGTWNSSFAPGDNDWQLALKAMAEKKLTPASLITHRFRLKDYKKAFGLMQRREEMYLKVMFVL